MQNKTNSVGPLKTDKDKFIFGVLVSTALISLTFSILNSLSLKGKLKEIASLVSEITPKLEPTAFETQRINVSAEVLKECLASTNKSRRLQCAINYLNSGVLDVAERIDPIAGARLKEILIDLSKSLEKEIKSV